MDQNKEVMIMDIAGLSMALSVSRNQFDFGAAVLSKNLDLMETMGEGVVDMLDSSALEQSVNPAVGGNIDIRV